MDLDNAKCILIPVQKKEINLLGVLSKDMQPYWLFVSKHSKLPKAVAKWLEIYTINDGGWKAIHDPIPC